METVSYKSIEVRHFVYFRLTFCCFFIDFSVRFYEACLLQTVAKIATQMP